MRPMDSGLRATKPQDRSDYRKQAMLSQKDRWCAAALAAALTYPAGFRPSVQAWMALLDELDASIKAGERRASAKLRAAAKSA